MVAIFVILTILLLVAIDVILERRRSPQETPVPVPYRQPEPVLPAGLFVHPGHTWAEILRSGLVRVGLDDFVRYAMGRPDCLILRQPGEQVRQGEPMLIVEQAGRRLTLPAPVSGVVERSNEQLTAHPEVLDGGAYGERWAYTLKPSRLGEEIGALQVAEKATAWLKGEMQALAAWVGGLTQMRPGVAMQDGGMPIFGTLSQVDENAWQDFQEKFLNRKPSK